MSSPHRKSTNHLVAIHRPSHHETREDFTSRLEARKVQWFASPLIKHNIVKSEWTIPNDSLDAHVQSAGLLVPCSIIVAKAEFETTEVLLEIMQHQGTGQVLSNPEFKSDGGADRTSARAELFLAHSQICIDREYASNKRVQVMLILERRGETTDGGLATNDNDYRDESKVESIIDRFINLGIVEKNVLKVTVFLPDIHMQMDVLPEHQGQAASRIGCVSHVEFENQDRMMELMNDGDLHELITTLKQDFTLTVTAADTVVVYQK
ncbi:hypothetical protein FB45DRAFT_1031782 [Roridomyces roridus]|uniref:Uncharacterized protein n=1 Tax=Roridomyces roridus TaxID=1738132 RepID=A0AAD7BI65_9AGAR|nr:hypothetical protein FB45DRAFT_1031782 [Roridomyces roridus]